MIEWPYSGRRLTVDEYVVALATRLGDRAVQVQRVAGDGELVAVEATVGDARCAGFYDLHVARVQAATEYWVGAERLSAGARAGLRVPLGCVVLGDRDHLGGVHGAQDGPAVLDHELELALGQLRPALLAAVADGLERLLLEVHAGNVTPTAGRRATSAGGRR